ncbi:MAG: MMPL family transporter [Opitutales bacterium]|nr:MMPL family transporter [Opitutales bacterium]
MKADPRAGSGGGRLERTAAVLFRFRAVVLFLFVAATAFLIWSALQLRVDAGFTKQLPLSHEYIQTFLEYQDEFGGANRVLIAFTMDEGDIFDPLFFNLLREATDEAYFIPGVDRAQVTSVWTPNVRFIEIVEDGFAGGNVVPADFQGTEEDLRVVRENIVKSGRLGQLVASDFTGAIISAQLLEVDPATGGRLDYIEVANHLEDRFREPFERRGRSIGLNVHIIGFAKVIGDVRDGAANVILFFFISLLITTVFVYHYAQSARLAGFTVLTAVTAVVWQLGLLRLLGFGIDPMSILVPFLVLAIGVSHGVQMVRSFRSGFFNGKSSLQAARDSFAQLLVPGSTALATDLIGFITILAIRIPIIQELAITASLGIFTLFFTNLLLLPVLLSFVRLDPGLRRRIQHRRERTDRFWRRVALVAQPGWSLTMIVIAVVLAVGGFHYAAQVRIGDLSHGVPELRPGSQYNRDSAAITERFDVGVNVITVICETIPNGCVDYRIMEKIDRLSWHARNAPGVQSVSSLPIVAKTINQGWNEGNPKWHILPRHPAVLGQAISPVDTATGLLNADGSVMPVYIFLRDHKAETIEGVIETVKAFRETEDADDVAFRLATGNVGVMGATNEVVAAAQFPMLLYVFSAVIVLCLIAFRSWRAAFCIVTPLAVVSILAYALMYLMEIGLKVSTLPVVALGVGVGVDYGIYLFFKLRECMRTGLLFEESLVEALRQTGSAVVFTGLTLAVGVSTWIFSALQFQADMGILLTFMFLFNMLGAILLLPAIARWLMPHHHWRR